VGVGFLTCSVAARMAAGGSPTTVVASPGFGRAAGYARGWRRCPVPAGSVVEELVTVGNNPVGVAYDGSNIWVANYGSGTVSKLVASV